MPEELLLSVDYYNAEEKRLFEDYPNFADIDRIVNANLRISREEFLTYMMFTEQADDEGWRTYEDLRARIEHRLGDIDDYFELFEGSIKVKTSSKRIHNAGLTERVGVTLGLNVVNEIHGLTEADWEITEDRYNEDGERKKDFDYQYSIASDGEKFIQVENKGNVAENNTEKSSVSAKKKSIKDKKEVLRAEEREIDIPLHQNLYYGTIGVLDSENTAKVWLIDPPAFEMDIDPKKFKLITRLKFYLTVFQEINIHKRIRLGLEERIKDIENSDNYEEYNLKRLPNSDISFTYIQGGNFAGINTNQAFGRFFSIKTDDGYRLFLIALRKEIIKWVIYQDFDAILDYTFEGEELKGSKAEVFLRVNAGGYTEKMRYAKPELVFSEKGKSYIYQGYQDIGYTSSGKIFGLVGD